MLTMQRHSKKPMQRCLESMQCYYIISGMRPIGGKNYAFPPVECLHDTHAHRVRQVRLTWQHTEANTEPSEATTMSLFVNVLLFKGSARTRQQLTSWVSSCAAAPPKLCANLQ
ncbi:hypothetical protein SKAU_G00201990 [Synaphobranchus kaupii]|uniref:Uncharacterized protein n=1 Tax=Synaphobranchus kaupii TaxID=118154 RepID=A0A9Q1FFN8_SYNKA|nr:hypothetical protein SKAU_G00201990 [Synaphobranchus kaupii]